jgi:hypothetical protein
MKAPITKIQVPKKLQTPIFKGDLGFGAWSFFGVWSLEFGAF